MNPALIVIGGVLMLAGLLPKKVQKTPEKVLTGNAETVKKDASTSNKRANTENDETVNHNENDSNSDGGGLTDAIDMESFEKPE